MSNTRHQESKQEETGKEFGGLLDCGANFRLSCYLQNYKYETCLSGLYLRTAGSDWILNK